jgi:hypothetical protein
MWREHLHGPQLQHSMHPGPQVPRQGGHTQQPLSRASFQSSPWRFMRQLLQKETGIRRTPHDGAVQVTLSHSVFCRHQWHVTPYLESYTLPPCTCAMVKAVHTLFGVKQLSNRTQHVNACQVHTITRTPLPESCGPLFLDLEGVFRLSDCSIIPASRRA